VKRLIAAFVAVLALSGLAACGSDTTPTTAGSSDNAVPHRIVSMSPTATEMLYAIGAGSQVVAVDSNSNFPADVPKTDLSAFEPNAEAIANYKPDLVVISNDVKNLRDELGALGIPVLLQPAASTLDDTYTQITELGDRTGHRPEADRLVGSMKQQIADLTKDLDRSGPQPTYFYELDNTLYTVTSKTFIGQVFSLAGLTNIADPADANGQSGGYPQLSPEFLVQADPDFVFLADTKCCAQDAATFAARPGFGGLKAVREGHVVPLDDDVASRWGPRVVDLLRQIVQATRGVPVG